MDQDNLEIFFLNFSTILCDFEKITTISKVLYQTLVENSDFEIRDTQNLCSILLDELKNTKIKLSEFEKNFSQYKSSCR